MGSWWDSAVLARAGWSGRDQDIPPFTPPPSRCLPATATLTCRVLSTHTALAPVCASLLSTERPGTSSAHLSPYTCAWRTAQDTCMHPGTLYHLSTGGSNSEVWKKCFTTVCNASREGCKLFRINHTRHNVQLRLLLLYFRTQ